jgi:ABC-type polysaccharide/polyol phosphate transport system ATPase subunit
MTIIQLDQVCLWRRTQEEFSYDLKKTIFSILEGKYRIPIKKLILDDISVVVDSGERVGIIGANGAGKSTLLKVICRILKPSSGQVRVGGAIAPLIELGAGFDPDLSVIDNILFYGVLLGFSRRDMRRRIDSILDFAELERDAYTPLKALSSGMQARLGFAIATDARPDILVLDEVLSIGDISFRAKCQQRLEQFWQTNVTILMVSHDVESIRGWCERVIWLDQGRIRFAGAAEQVINLYLDASNPRPYALFN